MSSNVVVGVLIAVAMKFNVSEEYITSIITVKE
jgi:hypothetical protein